MHWSKRTSPRRRSAPVKGVPAPNSWRGINTFLLPAHLRRFKRVRKYYARLVTRLEQRGGKKLVSRFYHDLRTFGGEFRLAPWMFGKEPND